ncbi:MAG: SurA N-terminal domain-containing protein [Pseudomonadota bacterium]
MFLKKIHGRRQGLLVKILLGFIIASFSIWGIADVIQKYWANRPIAKVGKFDISAEELSHTLNQETNRIQQMYNGKVDPAVLKKLQLHTIVLERLINQKALTQLLRNMHFSASDVFVGEVIRNQAAFKKDGFYDGALLREVLRSNGISEPKFLEQIREDIYKQQFAGTLASAMSLPNFAIDLITDALTTKHRFFSVTIPFSAIQLDKKATEDDLKLLFTQKAESYRIPEYRKAQVVIFDQSILAKNIKLSEEEITERYNSSLADFTQAERRIVRRVTYPNHAAAAAALEHLRKGRPMTAVVRDVPGGTYEDMGLLEKENLSENVRSVVFSLPVNKKSAPLENGTSYSIYEVTRIEPAVTQPLAAVRTKIEEDVRAQKYPEYFQDLRNSFDDDLAGGLKLSDAAAKHGLKVTNLSELNQNGEARDSTDALASLPQDIKMVTLEQIFALNENKDSLITDVSATKAFVVHVEKVIPSALPEFAAIKDTVKKDWERNQKREAAIKLASQLTKVSKDVRELKAHAKEHNFAVSRSHTIRRIDFELKEFKESESGKFFSALTPELLQKLFTVNVGKAIFDEAPNDKIVIMALKKTEPDTMDKATTEKIKTSIQKMTHQDIIPLLTKAARDRIDVTMNEELMKLVTRGMNDGD